MKYRNTMGLFSSSLSGVQKKKKKEKSNQHKPCSEGLAGCLTCSCCIMQIAEYRQLSVPLGNQSPQDSLSQQLFQL